MIIMVVLHNTMKESSKYLEEVRKHQLTWIMPGWSRTLFPGHGVPSCIVHPSSGTFCAMATNPFILTLNSSYSLCTKKKKNPIKTLKYFTIKPENNEKHTIKKTTLYKIVNLRDDCKTEIKSMKAACRLVTNLHCTSFPDKCRVNFIS